MTTLHLESEPVARAVAVTDDDLIVDLIDGRQLRVPLAWYPRLLNATTAERQNCSLLGEGYAIEWPDLDEHIGIEGLLAGRTSGENRKSLERWLDARWGALKNRPKSHRVEPGPGQPCRGVTNLISASDRGFCPYAGGTVMRNTVSSPGRLSHCTEPPWAVTISWTMASPRPLPPSGVPGTRK